VRISGHDLAEPVPALAGGFFFKHSIKTRAPLMDFGQRRGAISLQMPFSRIRLQRDEQVYFDCRRTRAPERSGLF
jgi:hypothetical protein